HTHPPFVGRAHELAQVARHVAGEDPAAPLLVLSGEPGIGKTRLLQETAARARAGGWCVLEDGCQRHSGQEPYAPLVGALARYVAEQTPDRVRRALQGCAWLVCLLPELVEQAVVPVPQWTLPAEQERRLLFAAVGQFLANVAGPSGTLLVLDDLQWAGSDALSLLESVLRRAPPAAGSAADGRRPLRVVGAYRDTEVRPSDPLGQALADLGREGWVRQVPVAPLPPEEALSLVVSVLHAAADAVWTEGEAQQIVQRAG